MVGMGCWDDVGGLLKLHNELGGGNSNIFGIFTLIFGEMIQFDDHIIQMG